MKLQIQSPVATCCYRGNATEMEKSDEENDRSMLLHSVWILYRDV